jgi:hypothetical protein
VRTRGRSEGGKEGKIGQGRSEQEGNRSLIAVSFDTGMIWYRSRRRG